MAISPKKAAELTREEKKDISAFERIIDSCLERDYDSNAETTIVNLPDGYEFRRPLFYEGIMDLYRKQGWKVELKEKQYSEGITRFLEFHG